MAMQDKYILHDCLETLKHLGSTYQAVAFECDSDALRKTLENIQIDRDEQRNAVFNLLHQMGEYKTATAETGQVSAKQQMWRQTLNQMQQRAQAAVRKEDPSGQDLTTR